MRGVGFRFAAPEGEATVTLRATLLLALAYVLLLALIALGVPLAVSLRDRVDSEVRGQARSQADVVAASASELLDPAAARGLNRLVRISADSVRGRVIVVDRRGRLLADSAGAPAGRSYASRPEIRAALGGQRRADHPQQQHPGDRASSPPRCRCSSTGGPAARCGSPRASPP